MTSKQRHLMPTSLPSQPNCSEAHKAERVAIEKVALMNRKVEVQLAEQGKARLKLEKDDCQRALIAESRHWASQINQQ